MFSDQIGSWCCTCTTWTPPLKSPAHHRQQNLEKAHCKRQRGQYAVGLAWDESWLLLGSCTSGKSRRVGLGLIVSTRLQNTSSSEPDVFERLLTPWQRRTHALAIGAWLAAIFFFWSWWLDTSHNVGTFWFALNTFMLGWIALLPAYVLSMYLSARVPSKGGSTPTGRAAMVVTKAPSEPWSMVRQTLEAMQAQDHSHDTWLADEDPHPETVSWCARNGVKISTRKGVTEYHRKSWPRRTRCKEGNLAYFYDHYGYANYDFVVQLDADHVPSEGYLREMLKPFADPSIGYVSAPSICDSNAADSWSARGRLFVDAHMHGLLQAAYSNGWAPLCIGSHYAVRTKALSEIGGLGPELAEDHSTTLLMNASGWRGAHAFNAIARGEGPCHFADLATQEFQWARSLVTILLHYSPRLVPQLPYRLRFQFLFCQLWYPLSSIFMLLLFLMPILAILNDRPFANVTFGSFLAHALPAELVIVGLALAWRAHGWCRPFNAKVISWEGILYIHARWPWMLMGCAAAIVDYFRPAFVDFRITRKGSAASAPLPTFIVILYGSLALVPGLVALIVPHSHNASGFYFFALLTCFVYTVLFIVIVQQHARETTGQAHGRFGPIALRHASYVVLLLLPFLGVAFRGPAAVEGLTWGSDTFKLTQVTYAASGAGRRGDRLRRVQFRDFSG